MFICTEGWGKSAATNNFSTWTATRLKAQHSEGPSSWLEIASRFLLVAVKCYVLHESIRGAALLRRKVEKRSDTVSCLQCT